MNIKEQEPIRLLDGRHSETKESLTLHYWYLQLFANLTGTAVSTESLKDLSGPEQLARGQTYHGFHRHFKGGLYYMFGVAEFIPTSELLVVYQGFEGERITWFRPLEMFLEKINVEGRSVRRFERLTIFPY